MEKSSIIAPINADLDVVKYEVENIKQKIFYNKRKTSNDR